jgi:undecaprenyl-diphosphatase
MSIAEAIISGVVQGLTEFLPVSSSGHLVLVHKFFGLSESSIFFDICLHVGTLMAVLVYFAKDIASLIREKRIDWLLFIAVATVPAVIAALLFEEKISGIFVSPGKVAYLFIVTALVLFAGQISQIKRTRPGKEPTFLTSLLVGISQAFALLPGVSRSGMTISSGLLGGMKAESAFKFSFLLSIPVILGATLYKSLKIDFAGIVLSNSGNYIAGMLTAFAVGFLSLMILWKAVKARRLFIFGIYCLLLGITGILFWK